MANGRELPHPTLIIGLGGTGQWIACHVLKDLIDLYGVRKADDISSRVQILAIDTDERFSARVGFQGEARGGRAHVGAVELPPSMKLSVGAHVHDYATEIASGKHPHLASWFDAKWFLALNNARGLMHLNDGASQFRPLGRLAVPYNLVQGDSSLRRVISQKIADIRTAAEPNDLNVCIAGSLCGGTGAGMVVDVAYLVLKLAGVPVKTRGYFVLPQAFDAQENTDDGSRIEFRRRAYAAQRELRRFARSIDSDYPMYYAGDQHTNDPIVRGHLNGSLFERLYYFDSSLTRSKKVALDSKDGDGTDREPAEVKDSLAPLIADAIQTWTDGSTSAEVMGHAANIEAQYLGRIVQGRLPAGAAVVGTFSSYTVQLPLYHLIEGWSHRLALNVLWELLGADSADPVSHHARYRTDFAGGHDGRTGEQVAREDWRGGELAGIPLTPFIQDILDTGDLFLDSGPTEQEDRRSELQKRPLVEWERLLAPSQGMNEHDDELRTEFLWPQRQVLQRRLLRTKKERKARVILASGSGKQDPKGDAGRLQRDVERYLRQHLGPQANTGERSADSSGVKGQYPTMLRRWSDDHCERFRAALEQFMIQTLNGDALGGSVDQARQNRAGKIGHLQEALATFQTMLTNAHRELDTIRRAKSGAVVESRKTTKVQQAAEEMAKKVKRQRDYLGAQQKVLEKEREYALLSMGSVAIREMQEFAESARKSCDAWVTLLANDLHRSLVQGKAGVASNLSAMLELDAVRHLLSAPEIEDKRWVEYTKAEPEGILNDFQWTTEIRTLEHGPSLGLELQLGDTKLGTKSSDLDESADRLLERSRQVFETAWDNEYLLGWLRELYKDADKGDLVNLIMSGSQPSLRIKDGAQPLKLGYVRAHTRDEDDVSWLAGLKTGLVREGELDAKLSQETHSSDPFRLTFLSMIELIDVERVTAYVEGRDGDPNSGGGYQNLQAKTQPRGGTSRQSIHVFPAEHNASQFEAVLGVILPDEVVGLLEDRSRFRTFLLAWAFGASGVGQPPIHEYRIPDSEGRQRAWIWRLNLRPKQGERDDEGFLLEDDEYWLTMPEPDAPRALVEAAQAFLVTQADTVRDPNRRRSIPYSRVLSEIEVRRQEMFDATKSKPDFGSGRPDLLAKIKKIGSKSNKLKAMRSLSDYLHLQSLSKKLADEIIPKSRALADSVGDTIKVLSDDVTDRDVIDQARRQQVDAASVRIDVALYQLMRQFIIEELQSLQREIQSYS